MDGDGDGYGDASQPLLSCSQPSSYVADASDCDDNDDDINPGAIETCDAEDLNCDGDAYQGSIDALTWYEDGDGDGFGSTTSLEACTQPAGHTDKGYEDDGEWKHRK